MSYKVTISVDEEQVYEQRTEALDLKSVIDAVNRSPQPQKERRTRSDAGTRRNDPRTTATVTNNTPEADPFG